MFLISAKFLLAILFCLPLLISCGDDTGNSNPNNPENPNNPIPDPEGTMTVNISETTYANFYDGDRGVGAVNWIRPNNIRISGDAMGISYNSICNIGKINGLGEISKIPSSGFTQPVTYYGVNTSLACEVGHGYVIKLEQKESNEIIKIIYVRLYIVESIISTSGGIMGARIKYQYPFEP